MFWRRRQLRENDLERELRSHLELEAQEHEQQGLSEEEARYGARRALGNTTFIKEEVREMWGWAFRRPNSARLHRMPAVCPLPGQRVPLADS